MQKIKSAVIGVGYLGKFHAEKYPKLPNAELVAVCDIDKARCKKIASLHNVSAVFDYHELFDKVDAVTISVPTTSHYEIAKKFLENNTHVLLEKPIAATITEADKLIEIAKNNNLILQVGHLERFNPVFTYIKSQLKKPMLIEAQRLSPFKSQNIDVNIILDLMIHDIDLILNLVQSKITNIEAYGASLLSSTTDIAYARFTFENGCTACLQASRVHPEVIRKLSILQQDSYSTGDLNQKTLHICVNQRTQTLNLEKNDAIFAETKAFIDSIINRVLPVVSGKDAKDALKIAKQISEKIEQ